MERPRLLTCLRNGVRVRNSSVSTERAYAHRAREYILFNGKRYPSGLGEADVRRFLICPAVERRAAASALNEGGMGVRNPLSRR